MKNTGIVIKSIDYKENSKIVYLYTNEGMKSIKAIGAKNPKKGLLGFTITGSIVTFIATDSSFPSLLEYNTESSLFDITNSISKINILNIIIDVINNLSDDVNHEAIYSFLVKTINELKDIDNPKKLLCVFLIKMLYPLGVAPHLKSCVSCNANANLLIDINKGGAICNSCNPLGLKNYHIWYEYYYKKDKITGYSDCNFDEILAEIKEYYYIHAGLLLKSI